jgi:hypothetical protein
VTRFGLACAAVSMLALAAPGTAAAQPPPQTIAESSRFRATSRLEDVTAFVRELQRLSPLVRIETLCTSAEGHRVPMLVVGKPAPLSPGDLRGDPRAVLYLQANIHGGEVEGKDALLMLVRDIVRGRTPGYLDKLVLLVVPVFNVDGNERISPQNRAAQDGPEGGVGTRYNGQNLDLNRDGIKIESPEVAGLVDVLNRWDPVFFLDSHTHNGSYHQEPVTWVWGLNGNGDAAVLDYMAGTMWPAVEQSMRTTYRTAVIPHGDFVDPRAPEKGWAPLEPQPRYLSNYVGLRNRLSVLNEQYPYADFETRVRGAYSLFRAFLDFALVNADAMTSLVRHADDRSIARGDASTAPGTFGLEWSQQPLPHLLTIQGYEMALSEGPNGRVRVKPTDTKKTYANVPYLAKSVASRSVALPRGYLITNPEPALLAKLRQHGIVVERMSAEATIAVEGFRVTALEGADQLNQGHYTNTVKGEYFQDTRRFPAGTAVVPIGQRLGALAATLLEAESDDGLLVWNAFDRALSIQWGSGPREYPVFRVHGTLPALRHAE